MVKLKSHGLRVVQSQFLVMHGAYICGKRLDLNQWRGTCAMFRWSLSARSIQKLYEIILITAANESFAEVIERVIWFNNNKLIQRAISKFPARLEQEGQRVNDNACTCTPD